MYTYIHAHIDINATLQIINYELINIKLINSNPVERDCIRLVGKQFNVMRSSHATLNGLYDYTNMLLSIVSYITRTKIIV